MKIALLLICLFQFWTNPQDSSRMIEIEFFGTYQTGRAPCEWLPDGSRRWAKTTGFNVSSVTKGDLQVGYLEIAQERYQNSEVQLQEGEAYIINITLTMERFITLKLDNEDTIMTYEEPILTKEIKSIEKKIE